MQKGTTDAKGQVSFGNVAPGKYLIAVDSKGLAAAVGKLDPKGLPATVTFTVTVQPAGGGKRLVVVTSYQVGGSSEGAIRPVNLTIPDAPAGLQSNRATGVWIGLAIVF